MPSNRDAFAHHPACVHPGPRASIPIRPVETRRPSWRHILGAASLLVLGGCAGTLPVQTASTIGGVDPKYGVRASPRLVAPGQPIPHGGGTYLVGRPYVVGGRTYYPSDRPYHAIGMASWYGDAFVGRRTANGEIFDKQSLAAAHPTMPLPSYARVTNLRNGWSVIVRVNDRGPYEASRVMDVSERVADVLDFKRSGTARVKIDYVGRAGLAGSDDQQLLATLRTDGSGAMLADAADLPSGFLAADDAPPSSATLAPIPPKRPDRRVAVATADSGVTEQPETVDETVPTPPVRKGIRSKSPALALGYAAKPQVLSEDTDTNPLADGVPMPVRRPDTN